MKYHVQARIAGNSRTGEGIFLLTLEAPDIAAAAQPGQFIHLRCGEGLDPLLRRPFSIYGTDRATGCVLIWYQVVGKGTALLAQKKKGDVLDVLGPLGRGFHTDLSGKTVWLAGGGMGAAPLMFLAATLAEKNSVQGFFGARTQSQLPPGLLARPAELPAAPPEYFVRSSGHSALPPLVATEDGSAGFRGLVTELLQQKIDTEPERKPDMLYACGPQAMLKKVAGTARQHGVPLQVSLEAAMACGVGACLGCTCAKSAESAKGGSAWLKACQDGPVFWAEEVEWA